MATPNYAYEKRQRELAKKNKKQEKLREKAERKTHPQPGDDGAAPVENKAAEGEEAEGGSGGDGGGGGD